MREVPRGSGHRTGCHRIGLARDLLGQPRRCVPPNQYRRAEVVEAQWVSCACFCVKHCSACVICVKQMSFYLIQRFLPIAGFTQARPARGELGDLLKKKVTNSHAFPDQRKSRNARCRERWLCNRARHILAGLSATHDSAAAGSADGMKDWVKLVIRGGSHG